MRQRGRRLVVGALAGFLGVALLLPSGARAVISKNQAALTALTVFAPRNARRPVIVFGIRHPVSGYVADAGPDSRQPIRYVRGSHGTESVVTTAGTRVKRRVWLFWEDLVPYTEFAHPSLLLLIDARTGRVQRLQQYEWWPVVNGSKPPFLQGNGYDNPRYRLFGNAVPPTPARDLTASAGPAHNPTARVSQAQTKLPSDCLVQQFDKTDNSFVADATLWSQFARDSGFVQDYTTNTLAGMEKALVDAAGLNCTDALIYLGGHGFAATGANLNIGKEKAAESQFGQLITKWLPQKRGSQILTDTVSAASLADTLVRVNKQLAKSHKKMDYKVIIQSCFAGRFLQYKRLDELTKFIGGAAGITQGASGTDNRKSDGWYICPDPSYYSKKLIDRLRTTPPFKLPDRLVMAAGEIPLGPNGEQPVYWNGTNVVGEGGGTKGGGGSQGVPQCPAPGQGGIDLLLQGEFFGRLWASGTVTATPSNGSPTETGAVGYDSTSVSHFGPWPCGTTTTLRATPDRGNHFDHWASNEGLCATTAPTCTVPITTTAHQITAYFAPTVYQLTVTNLQPDGIVTSGSSTGYVYPGIDCGSQPNGSVVVQVYTKCVSGAWAQRSDSDAAQLYIDADNPGPGGHQYAIASIDGCDRSVATTYPVPGGGGATYTPHEQCFIDMNSNRTITVSYTAVGP